MMTAYSTIQYDLPETEESKSFVVKMNGLPYSVTNEEIVAFFEPEIILESETQIHRINNRDGRFSGNALIELQSRTEMEDAIAKHRKHIGSRYVEIYESDVDLKPQQRTPSVASGTAKQPTHIVLLRGLPFSTNKDEITDFFEGLDVSDIWLVPDSRGRWACNGDAFVAFGDRHSAVKAKDRHRKTLGSRWVEVYDSDVTELNRALGRPEPRSEPRYDARNTHHGFIESRDSRERIEMDRRRLAVDRERITSLIAEQQYRNLDPYVREREVISRHPRDVYQEPQLRHTGGFAQQIPFQVRLIGAPYDVERSEIVNFLRPARVSYMEFTKDNDGKVNDVLVELPDQESFGIAMERHKANIRHRYIEVVNATDGADNRVVYQIKMRGLPYECDKRDIVQFFSGIAVKDVELLRDREGRVTDAVAVFQGQHDHREAMRRDRDYIGNRYISLVDTSIQEESRNNRRR